MDSTLPWQNGYLALVLVLWYPLIVCVVVVVVAVVVGVLCDELKMLAHRL